MNLKICFETRHEDSGDRRNSFGHASMLLISHGLESNVPLLMRNSIIKKGVFTKEEFLEMVKMVDREMKRKQGEG
jgi:hypothetical protein